MRNKKKRIGIISRIQYYIDNALTKGMKSMMLILLIAVVALSLIFGTVLCLTSNDVTFLSGIWDSIMHIIDPGTITGDDGKSFVYMALMSVATVCGLVIISTLIGIINTSITIKLENLKKGKSKIIENDHIVILGFDEEIYKIIDELIIANREESKKRKSIVILDSERNPEEMEEAVNKRIPNKHNTRIIYRKGIIYDTDSIDMCSVNTCRSVIVNVESDFVTIKCILAVASILKDKDNVHITAVIKNSDYKEAAMLASNNKVLLLNFEEIIAKIIAQSGRHTGASYIFSELFDFAGSEFYTIPADEKLVGLNINEVNLHCSDAVFVGKEIKIEDSYQSYLYPCIPQNEKIIKKDDRLIFIAENSHINCTDNPYHSKKQSLIRYNKENSGIMSNTLILRYSRKIETILLEQYKFLDENSRITVAVKQEDVHKVEQLKEKHKEKFKNLDIVKNFDFSTERLKSLIAEVKPESVIVLASTSDNRNDFEMSDMRRKMLMHREDSEIILLLLQLRSLVDKSSDVFNFSITSEIQYSENQKLVSDTGVNDFVVGSVITNEILAQVARQKNRLGIFQDIITAGGSDIIFKPATDYMDAGTTIKIFDVFAAESKNESEFVFIGYKKEKADENGEYVFINPPKKSEYVCEEKDLFIFIGKE